MLTKRVVSRENDSCGSAHGDCPADRQHGGEFGAVREKSGVHENDCECVAFETEWVQWLGLL